MGRRSAEQHLPQELLQRASLRGNEYAWRLDDIPLVIQAAKVANLVNVGGQLQFRIPDGATREIYEIEVNTYRSVPKSLPWTERVKKTAIVALDQFNSLKTDYDLIPYGRHVFGQTLAEAEANGYSLEEIMCFVWYVRSEEDEAAENDR